MSYRFKVFAIVTVFLFVSIGMLYFAGNSQAGRVEHWITVDEKELAHIQAVLHARGDASLNLVEVKSVRNGIAVLQLNDPQMEKLSQAMHDNFHKCSGFIAHQNQDEAMRSIDQLALVDSRQQFVSYTIDNQTNVNALLAEAREADNRQVIIDLSAFPNRRYNQPSGLNSANWIKDKWTALAAGRSDVTVEFYNHPSGTSPQPSIIMTIQGTTLPDEIVVLGGHQDSINTGGATLPAPGADDDASGIACLTETIRVLMVKNFRPNRTLKFMAYAAEEVGLRGSNAIATDFRTQNKNVVGVLQLDMTNYKGVLGNDIVIFQDYTNAAQNQFVRDLITTYQPTLVIGTSSCGYACSDHASWFNKSYPASFTFESTFNDDNTAIHTANDTLAVSGNNANHALKFTKLSISFVGELAKGAIVSPRRSPFDYDGDGKSDISVFRPSTGTWYLQQSQAGLFGMNFGVSTDKITPADFDGDGKTDIAVYRPSTGYWHAFYSSNSTFTSNSFGVAEDLPAPGDFDGDGKADVSVFRPSIGTWYRVNSSTGAFVGVQFGASDDKPAMGDFDGDGKADIAVYRPSSGSWYRLNSSNGLFVGAQFGIPTDVITPADFDGDGKTDIAVYRPSVGTWYIIDSSTATVRSVIFGLASDIPSAGDFDGDGKADVSVFRPSDGTWYRLNSSTGVFVGSQFGANGDTPTESAFSN